MSFSRSGQDKPPIGSLRLFSRSVGRILRMHQDSYRYEAGKNGRCTIRVINCERVIVRWSDGIVSGSSNRSASRLLDRWGWVLFPKTLPAIHDGFCLAGGSGPHWNRNLRSRDASRKTRFPFRPRWFSGPL